MLEFEKENSKDDVKVDKELFNTTNKKTDEIKYVIYMTTIRTINRDYQTEFPNTIETRRLF